MIKKQQKWIAVLVTLTFAWLLQVSAMPLGAANAPDQAQLSSTHTEQGPSFIEEEGEGAYKAEKKSILPVVLIGLGVAAVVAVLVLVVFKTSNDITGTWEMEITYLTAGYTNRSYTSTWVFTGTKEGGNFVENDEGTTYPGTYKVTDKKKVEFRYNAFTDIFLGEFTASKEMSGTFSTSKYNGTWKGKKTSSTTAALRPTKPAAPATAFPKPKRG